MGYYNYNRSRRSAYSRPAIRGGGRYTVAKARRAPVRRLSRPRIRGAGAYTLESGPWANRGATAGGVLGDHYLPGGVGKRIGSWLGRRLFHYPAKLFGSGAYQIAKGPVSSNTMTPRIPTFAKGENYVTIAHREYVGDIITSGSANTFKVDTFLIQPTLNSVFPWLSTVCKESFQQYKFDGLIFEFQSYSGDSLNSVNTALGSVVAAINYDVTDPDFSTRNQIENTQWSMAGKPSKDFSIPVEVESSQTAYRGMLFTRLGPVPANTDPKTYDLGKLSIATTGFQGTDVNIGSLYVNYKIRLYKPIMVDPAASNMLTIFDRTGAGDSTPTGTATVSNINACNGFNVTLTTTTITFDKKVLINGTRFLIALLVVGDSTASVTAPTMTLGNGFGFRSDYVNFANTQWTQPSVTGTQTQCSHFATIEVVNRNLTLTCIYGGSSNFPDNAACTVYISQVNGQDPRNIGGTIPV